MKKLSLICSIVLILTALANQPVAAEESTYGFIPLLNDQFDPSLPREVQSREAFDALLPELAASQKNGVIGAFEPDYYGGFVRVALPDGTLKGTDSLRVRKTLDEVLVRPITAQQSDLKAPPEVVIYLTNYSSCFYVYGVAEGLHISGKLSTPSAELVGAAEGQSDASLYYWDCFDGSMPTVLPGYLVEFQIDLLAGPPVIYTTTVPQNTFNTIAKSTASVTGQATPNLPYALDWYHAMLDPENNYRMLREEGTIPSSGSWSETYADKFRGGDHLVLILETDEVFHHNTSMDIPYFSCVLRSPVCIYRGFPKKAVSMTVTHSGTAYTFSGTTNRQGEFPITLEDAVGAPVQLTPGDVIAATGALNETLPTLTAFANRATDKITGKAPLYNYFEVNFTPHGTDMTTRVWLKTKADGKYAAAFAALGGIPDTGLLKVKVLYIPVRSGNVTQLLKMFP